MRRGVGVGRRVIREGWGGGMFSAAFGVWNGVKGKGKRKIALYDTMMHSGFVLLHNFLRYWREGMVMDTTCSI